MTAAAERAAARFRDALIGGDPSALALVVDRLRHEPVAAARWLRLVKRGRPKRDGRCAALLRRLRACATFAPLSTNAAAAAIAKFLSRYAVSGWRFERDAPSNPHGDGADRRAVAWELATTLGRRFPPSVRTVRRAISNVGQK